MNLLTLILLLNINASDVKELILYKDFDHKISETYFESSKIFMNQACKNEELKCLNFLKSELKKIKPSKNGLLKGNPASDLCKDLKGQSVIYYDKEHNEYDYCKINAYEFSSWDVYYNLKK